MWLYFMKKQDQKNKNLNQLKKEKLAQKLRENLKKRKKIKK